MDKLEKKLRTYFVSSADATEILNISRQHLNSLAKRGKIDRIKKNGLTLYYRDEVLERSRCQEQLRKKYRPYDYEGRNIENL
jgi:hypothetical protein